MLRDILRHPLLHFLVLGAGLYLLYLVLADDTVAEANTEIVVSEGRLNNLREVFARTWQRPPTAAELDGLVEDFVREEIYYREALALGLDRDDTIVRRRLRQKYEFLAADSESENSAPTDAELTAFIAANSERFGPEVRYTFEQVFFDSQRRGDRAGVDAAVLLKSLQAGRPLPADSGDRLLIGTKFSGVGKPEVTALFGPAFAAALATVPVGPWAGPLESGYGIHLVRMSAAESGQPPALAEIRAVVLRDYADQQRREAQEENYRTLRARYKVVVEPAAAEAVPSSGS